MKRTAKKLEQKAWRYEDMYPQFVSIVETGANFIPFSTIKFADLGQEFTEGYDVAKIVFPISFSSDEIQKFLDDKQIIEYSVKLNEDGSSYVENPNLDLFEDTKTITMSDGVEIQVGKTTKATKQVKTKIEESKPVIVFSEVEELESVIVTADSGEVVDEVVDGTVDEVEVDETVVLEESVTVEVPVVDEVVDEVADTETVTEVVADEAQAVEDSTLLEPKEDEPSVKVKEDTAKVEKFASLEFKEALKLTLADNRYLEALSGRKVYIAMNLLTEDLMQTIFVALQQDDRDEAIANTTREFGEAILKVYYDLDYVSMKSSEDEEDEDEDDDYDQTGATIIGEEEPETILASDDPLKELKNEIISLKVELQEFKKNNTVDLENVLMQTSKADVSAFDKSLALEEKPITKVHNKSTKNLFGI